MTKSEISIIKAALMKIDDSERKYYFNLSKSEFSPSEKYVSAINKFFVDNSGKCERFFTRKRIAVAVLIAAIIISLVGCAFAFAKPILNFIEENFGENTKMTLPDEYSKQIEDAKTPIYIPEGYTQVRSTINGNIVFVEWSFGDKKISYMQHITNNSSTIYDTEDNPYKVAYIGEQAVYYITKYNDYNLIWEDGEYQYSMLIPSNLGWEEVEKIVLSIKNID